jgi:N-terminal acetyltransferase B complex non-catalytic subunit
MGIDEIVEKVDYLHEMYTDALEHGKDLLATEVQLGDDFMILAAHALHDCFVKSGGNLHFIWQAVVLLEDALSRSRFNFQFKILLIRFYMRLGVFLRAQELFATMEVKHVILDSLGYIITDSARSFGFNQAAEDHFDTAYSIYKSNWSEVFLNFMQTSVRLTCTRRRRK